ncbi:endolytic transglycosylase MltG [Xenorhabdus bovienii]|uniref:Endolytic murein transglycosylase n=1 Tax=Xenorhabdus bovienii str. kraussei Quebec TaxID=1398203 RepID=A0A077PEJ7_XENBV|nr:endolytic transglycosylase MltG [Xenorhabdus bovienii]MDE1473390.1 endolytic transglycosylase MltG [Xenorhabdus bovienii]MDE9427294.1 endolytic transglycosylase MltG [Xenorhabdus bovienii]MDE9456490.1 endolytic transglycosylase MltG [Xenorhabdus bovienii]MDE9464017.1 endolytic transglycosylase MltG [Xenorhabdus bovienii]MDE9484724.1 endolytic transglycosylase MltG [Xenorhabdus bovienii]
MKLKKRIFILPSLIIMIVAIMFFSFVKKIENFANQKINLNQEMIFTVPAGTGRAGLGILLVQHNLIKDHQLLSWLFRLKPELAKFKAGTYRLQQGMSLRAILQLFSSGKEVQFSIRFVEGSRLSDWEKILQNAPYLKHEAEGKSPKELTDALDMKAEEPLEGWLYPDTYLYTAGTSDVELLKRAHQKMNMALEQEWKNREKNLPYKNAYEMLIMASIIEKETAIDSERTKVASVFINRLRLKMRLQTDPTVIYGLGDKYTGSIFRSNLTAFTPYNTYMIEGLPPTPIAMPSLASIKAAAHPAVTGYLYFVANGNGGHTFTANLAEHNRAVNLYRQRLKQDK